MPKLARRIFAGLGICLSALAVVVLMAWWATRQTPDFYQRSLAQPQQQLEEDGERLEQQALALHNQLHHEGRFEARFTEEEINAWLAEAMPEKFPRLLPSSLSEPRVAIEAERLRLAVRFQRGNIDTVLSLAAEAYLTGEPNELAIRISQVRAGLLPVPFGQLLGDIERRAMRAGLVLRWREEDGEAVGVVRLPSELQQPGSQERGWQENDGQEGGGQENKAPRTFLLEDVRLSPGELVVIGSTQRRTEEAAVEKDGPINTADQSAESDTHQR